MPLAQLNIADAKFETDADQMVGFTGRVEAVNDAFSFALLFDENGRPVAPEFPKKDCA